MPVSALFGTGHFGISYFGGLFSNELPDITNIKVHNLTGFSRQHEAKTLNKSIVLRGFKKSLQV